MYRYDELDQKLVDERVAQFRGQTQRFLAGKLSEDEFRSLRLRNGLYVQRFAPMLRISIPYGLLSSKQLRMLGRIARTYDKGYGHFTTRQNLQFNWPKLEQVPDILADLATVQMHAIQTSGNCIRQQHHRRPPGRRGGRRTAGSASLLRADPAVGQLPPGIQLAAAQVQDRLLVLDQGPRCAPRCTTSACTSCATRPANWATPFSSAAAWAGCR